jgi:hypothetical protein
MGQLVAGDCNALQAFHVVKHQQADGAKSGVKLRPTVSRSLTGGLNAGLGKLDGLDMGNSRGWLAAQPLSDQTGKQPGLADT